MMIVETQPELAPGDVVQLNPAQGAYAYCMLVVTQVKHWGIVGYIQSPQRPKSGQVFYRAENGSFAYIGKGVWK